MDTFHYATASITHGANPFLIGWWICAVSLGVTPKPRRRYVLGMISAAIIAVAAMEVAKSRVIWPLHPTFPSGHEAFAAVMLVGLWYAKRIWGIVAGAGCIVLGVGLVIHRAHQPIDLVGGFFAGLVIAAATLAACRLRATE